MKKIVLITVILLFSFGCVDGEKNFESKYKTEFLETYELIQEIEKDEKVITEKTTLNNVLIVKSNSKFKSAHFITNKVLSKENLIPLKNKVKIKNKKFFVINRPSSMVEVSNIKKFVNLDEDIFILKNIDKDIKLKVESKSKIAMFFEEMLLSINNVIKSFGVTIILFTILIKLVLLPLTLKQDKSMKAMKKLQPEIEKLKAKHGKNPQDLNRETMMLYQEHKVNPLGGCLPMLVQLPILLTLFRVLKSDSINTIIPLNEHFLIWNLGSMDQTKMLPILNGIIMFLQQKMMGNGEQNEQMKMMMYMMPIMIIVISMQMPVGLQIYWLTSSLIGVLQHYFIMKKGEN